MMDSTTTQLTTTSSDDSASPTMSIATSTSSSYSSRSSIIKTTIPSSNNLSLKVPSTNETMSNHHNNKASLRISTSSTSSLFSPSALSPSVCASVSVSPSTPNATPNATPTAQPQREHPAETRQQQQQQQQQQQMKVRSSRACFPVLFEVITQARVRSRYEMNSTHITDLPEGSIITVEEIRKNRARISAPICGWLSKRSKYGSDKIIRPLNNKIGGKVYIYTTDTKGIPATYCADIIDYSVTAGMYQIEYRDEPYKGKTQWVDLRSPACYYVPKQRPRPVCLDNIDPVKQSQHEQFLHGFFVADYPGFKKANTPNSAVCDPVNQAMTNGAYQQRGINQNVPSYPYYNYNCYQQIPQYQQQQYQQQYVQQMPQRAANVTNDAVSPQRNAQCQSRLNERDAVKKQQVQTTNSNNNNVQTTTVAKAGTVQHTKEENVHGNTQTVAKPKSAAYIRAKLKQIEERIVHHLHDKGYTKEHPEYARYLEKAKQCALKKAFKQQQMRTVTTKV